MNKMRIRKKRPIKGVSFGDHPKGFRHSRPIVKTEGSSHVTCSLSDPSAFAFLLTVLCLAGIAIATYLIPILEVRIYLPNWEMPWLLRTLTAAFRKHDFTIVSENWPLNSYPQGPNEIRSLIQNRRYLLELHQKPLSSIDTSQRRLSVHWRDCVIFSPMVILLFMASIGAQIYFRVHPLWREASPIVPLLALAIFHSALMILQLAILFGNVQMHRNAATDFRDLAMLSLEDMTESTNGTSLAPWTYCMSPPTNYSTIILLTIAANILIIFLFLDSMDSEY